MAGMSCQDLRDTVICPFHVCNCSQQTSVCSNTYNVSWLAERCRGPEIGPPAHDASSTVLQLGWGFNVVCSAFFSPGSSALILRIEVSVYKHSFEEHHFPFMDFFFSVFVSENTLIIQVFASCGDFGSFPPLLKLSTADLSMIWQDTHFLGAVPVGISSLASWKLNYILQSFLLESFVPHVAIMWSIKYATFWGLFLFFTIKNWRTATGNPTAVTRAWRTESSTDESIE